MAKAVLASAINVFINVVDVDTLNKSDKQQNNNNEQVEQPRRAYFVSFL